MIIKQINYYKLEMPYVERNELLFFRLYLAMYLVLANGMLINMTQLAVLSMLLWFDLAFASLPLTVRRVCFG